MKKQFFKFIAIFAFALFAIPQLASAASSPIVSNSLVGVQGYDLVSYHSGKPLKGNGNHVIEHNGVTYVFANEANQKAFEANPLKYIPAYGGYCAFGVSVGKKFVGDPEVWKIVNGVLYLNLDKKVQGIWNKDIPGNIHSANKYWLTIKGKAAADL